MSLAIHEDLTLEQVAALVCDTLSRQGISVVLSGGAVVSIYSENRYPSNDLDFVFTGFSKRVDAVMEKLGFTNAQRRWVHPHSRYRVEFLPGPVVVGDQTLTEFAHRESDEGALRLLPPTECVMDRLVGVSHDSDPQCLEQAVAVAKLPEVDLVRIERWASGEGPGGPAAFGAFIERLAET